MKVSLIFRELYIKVSFSVSELTIRHIKRPNLDRCMINPPQHRHLTTTNWLCWSTVTAVLPDHHLSQTAGEDGGGAGSVQVGGGEDWHQEEV